MNKSIQINQGGGFPFGLKDRGMYNALGNYVPVPVNENPVQAMSSTLANVGYWNFSRAVGNGETVQMSDLQKINDPIIRLQLASTRGLQRQNLNVQLFGNNLKSQLGQTAPSDKMNSLGAEGVALPDSGNEFV